MAFSWKFRSLCHIQKISGDRICTLAFSLVDFSHQFSSSWDRFGMLNISTSALCFMTIIPLSRQCGAFNKREQKSREKENSNLWIVSTYIKIPYKGKILIVALFFFLFNRWQQRDKYNFLSTAFVPE